MLWKNCANEEILVKKYHIEDQANVEVGENQLLKFVCIIQFVFCIMDAFSPQKSLYNLLVFLHSIRYIFQLEGDGQTSREGGLLSRRPAYLEKAGPLQARYT